MHTHYYVLYIFVYFNLTNIYFKLLTIYQMKQKLIYLFSLMLMCILGTNEALAGTVTATWDWQNSLPSSITASTTEGNDASGSIASDVDGITLDYLAAESGAYVKLQYNSSGYAQFNVNTAIRIPVISTSDIVTVVSYPGQYNYTVGGTAASANETQHTATKSEVKAGYVEIVATSTAYLYSISVVQDEDAAATAAAGETISCSALVPSGHTESTFNETTGITTGQTNCTLMWSGLQAGSNKVTVDDVDYYKMGGANAYVQLILTSGKFQAGDVVSATVARSSDGNVVLALKSDGGNKFEQGTVSAGATTTITKTLVAADIEDDGSIKIFCGGDTSVRVAAFSVTGTRNNSLEESDLTVTSSTSLNIAIGATSTITYTTSSDGDVSFASSKPSIATVTDAGVITGVAGGTTTISVTQEATDTYDEGSASVTVVVPYNHTAANEYTIGSSTYGFSDSSNKYYFTNGFTMTNSGGKGWGNGSLSGTGKYSAGTTYTIQIPEGVTVSSATITGKSNYSTTQYAYWGELFGEDYSDVQLPQSDEDAAEKTITFDGGATGTLTFKPKGNQVLFKIVLNADNRAESDLAITSATSVSLDDVTTTSQITYSTSADDSSISYTSSNIKVATVSSTGLITAVANGTCTITVSQKDDANYKDDSKSVTVTVNNGVIASINISAIVNNQTGTLITSSEISNKSEVNFGVNENSERVEADASDAILIVNGKYHSDHGLENVSFTVGVPGAVKIGIGQCTYSGNAIVVKDGNGTTVINKTPAKACWKNDHSNVTYQYYTGDATTLTISGMAYCPFVSVASVTLNAVTGTISGGTIDGANVILASATTGQEFTATVAEGAFSLNLPADTYSVSLENATGYVLSSPSSVDVTGADALTINVVAATEQAVTGTIVNAPAEDFVLTFTPTVESGNIVNLNCNAGATSYSVELMPDTYTISSSVGTLSPLSVESFQVVNAAVSHNIYFPEEAVPAATQQNITVDNTLAAATANNYKSVSDAIAAAKAGSISAPVITLTSGQTYREQVIVDIPNVTLKTSGTEKATITFYYGIGYTYYSLNDKGYYDKDRAMTRNSINMIDPSRWGTTVLVKSTGYGFKAENITFENSFNLYYTEEEVADGVKPNGVQSINYDRTLTSGDPGYKAADAKDVTERAAAIGFENNPAGCQLYNCKLVSSQDTYYTSGTIYTKDCDIQGNTDYIFGGGKVVFDNCNLVIGGYSDKKTSAYITAQSGSTGDAYIFRDCKVTSAGSTYTLGNLGRDWGGASATVYYFNLKNEIGSDLEYKWNNMGGGVSAGTANLHIYDFDQTVNANYSTPGSTGANVNGLLSDADALGLYAGVVSFLGFTPERIYEDNLVLGESSAYNICRIAASDNVERNVELTRAISAGKWGTIVLPFAMTEAQLKAAFGDDVKVAKLSDNSTADNLSFTSVTATEANKAYAIKVSSAFASATIEGVTIVEATPTQEGIGDQWSTVGTYAASTIPTGSFYFSSNSLKKAGATGTHSIKPFRAYFTYTGSGSTPDAVNYSFDGEATAIDGIAAEANDANGAIYTISGQRVSQPVNGVNIVNGKKVVK